MLKRVVPKILIASHGNDLVGYTTKHFELARIVGDPQSQARILQDNLADELIVIVADQDSRSWSSISLTVSKIVESVFMPITIGGILKNYSDVERVFDFGVERLLVGQMIIENPKLIEEISNSYGQQSLVASIDFWGDENLAPPGSFNRGVLSQGEISQRIKLVEELGVGEILLCDVSRDGTRKGSNLEILRQVRDETSLPIIDSCGFGKTQHFVNSFNSGADAIAVATYLAFMDQSFIQLKRIISGYGIPMRLQ